MPNKKQGKKVQSENNITKKTIANTQRREGYFKGFHNDELYYQLWLTKDADETIIITHGLSEHSDCYHLTAEALNKKKYNVLSWDLRGHGRSMGKRGYVQNFIDFTKDLNIFLEFLHENQWLTEKYFYLGHSMGGLIILRHLLRSTKEHPSIPIQCAGVILSAPCLGIENRVPFYRELSARFLQRFAPEITVRTEISYENLSSDKEQQKKYEKDPLRHDRISAPLYFGLIDHSSYVKAHALQINLPVFILAAGHENVVDSKSIEDFYLMLETEKKGMKVYKESRHEILNDREKEAAIDDISEFIKTVHSSKTKSPPHTKKTPASRKQSTHTAVAND